MRQPAHVWDASLRGWLHLVAGLLAVAGAPLATCQAQGTPARSIDYLFITGVDDARAAWVNPAGLGWLTEASVMAEAVLDRTAGRTRLGQYTLGLNSRGLAVAYERDRSRDSIGVGILRVGLGLPLGKGSIGAAMSNYGGTHDQGYDLGLRYPVINGLDLGLVARNLGRPQPVVREGPQSIVLTAGGTWVVAARVAEISAEAIGVERLAASGYDMSYRGGIVLRTSWPWALALHAVAEMDRDGALRRWSLGLILGARDHLGLVASASPTAGLGEPERFSALGLASRRPGFGQ